MTSLRAIEIEQVVGELTREWTGSFIQKVHVHGRSDVYLTLRRPDRPSGLGGVGDGGAAGEVTTSPRSGVLHLSVAPGSAHLCLGESRGEVDSQASSFCMVLRKLLKGGRLEALEAVGGDRVVEIRTRRGALVAEMIGARGSLVAVDADRKIRVLLCVEGRPREGLRPGRPYEPPPAMATERGAALAREGGANAAVRGRFHGVSASSEPLEVQRQQQLAAVVRKKLKKVRRTIAKVEGDLRRLGDPGQLAHMGELLKGYLGQVRPGQRSIDVVDYLDPDGSTTQIPLDPSLGGSENMAWLFVRARKAARGAEHVTRRLEELRRQEGALAVDLERVLAAQTEEELTELAGGIAPRSTSARRTGRGGSAPRLPYHEFRALRGGRILVGRSAKDNDALTTSVARPWDLWLHAKGQTGSHVVVPLSRGQQVDGDALLDAATLAAHFSGARGEELVEISYTSRRFVRKPKGSPKGLVTIAREKVLLLRFEPARLARLLASSDRP